jgi:hypothetical protein
MERCTAPKTRLIAPATQRIESDSPTARLVPERIEQVSATQIESSLRSAACRAAHLAVSERHGRGRFTDDAYFSIRSLWHAAIVRRLPSRVRTPARACRRRPSSIWSAATWPRGLAALKAGDRERWLLRASSTRRVVVDLMLPADGLGRAVGCALFDAYVLMLTVVERR